MFWLFSAAFAQLDFPTGDIYFCTAYLPLHINRPNGPYPPAEYKEAKRKTLPGECTKEDMNEFVIEFMYSDVSSLNPISRATFTVLHTTEHRRNCEKLDATCRQKWYI